MTMRRAVVPGIAVFALALTGCGAGNETPDSSGSSDSPATGSSDGGTTADLSGELNGGGATSQEKAENAWRTGFQTANPDVTVNYDPIGSGDGRANFINEAFSFAGTDSALDDDEGELSAAGERCGGGNVIQVPAYVSPIAVMFNLGEDILSLNLSGEVVSNIFNGTITKWNDDAIASLNDGVDLPTPPSRRSTARTTPGTTENFTKYLEAAGNGAWSFEPDGVWPDALSGEAADGTSGVVGVVSGGEGTIGYADASAVGDLGVASIQVGDEFNPPSCRGCRQGRRDLPARRGRRRDRHGRRPGSRHHRVGHLPGPAGVLPDRLRDLRRRRDGRPGEGLPRVRPLAGGPGRRERRGRFGSAGLRGRRQGHRHRRGHQRRVSTDTETYGGPFGGRRTRAVGDRIFSGISLAAGISILVSLGGVFLFLFIKGYGALSVDESVFRGSGATDFVGYVWPLVYGTALAAVLALVIATPFAIGIALFISHYAPKRLASPIAYVMDLLAAVPSVVFGLWGGRYLASYLQPAIRWLADHLSFLPFFSDEQVSAVRPHHAHRGHRPRGDDPADLGGDHA